jgi:hypothetical protein
VFEHVALLLSFIYVIALTHLLSSTTSLILARDRVRFSPLLALWMLLALGILFNNWLAIGMLRSVEHWTVGLVALEFGMAIVQYFACSLVSMEVKAGEVADMAAWYEKQRVAFLGAFASVCVLAMLTNYLNRDNSLARSPASWIPPDLSILAVLMLIVAAMLVRAKWLQWVAAVILAIVETVFIVLSVVPD